MPSETAPHIHKSSRFCIVVLIAAQKVNAIHAQDNWLRPVWAFSHWDFIWGSRNIIWIIFLISQLWLKLVPFGLAACYIEYCYFHLYYFAFRVSAEGQMKIIGWEMKLIVVFGQPTRLATDWTEVWLIRKSFSSRNRIHQEVRMVWIKQYACNIIFLFLYNIYSV